MDILLDSRATSLQHHENYSNSAPLTSEWGQPPASCFIFQASGTTLIGHQISGPYLQKEPWWCPPYSEIVAQLKDEFDAWESASDQDISELD